MCIYIICIYMYICIYIYIYTQYVLLICKIMYDRVLGCAVGVPSGYTITVDMTPATACDMPIFWGNSVEPYQYT